MKPKMFRFQLSLAGVSDDDIELIERWIVDRESPFSDEEIRDAVFEYTKICMDIDVYKRQRFASPTKVRACLSLCRRRSPSGGS